MVTIVSEDVDITTKIVIDWFLNRKKEFKISNSTLFNSVYNRINNDTVSIQIDDIDSVTVKKIWHRRGKFVFKSNPLHTELNKYLKSDEKVLQYNIENILKENIEYIGSFKNEVENNKLDVILLAKNIGLLIPDTLITSKKTDLQDFFSSKKSIITKDLYHPVWFKIKNTQYSSVGTIQITQTMIDKCNDYFIPMFLQEKIEKKYEVRIFHYKDKLFPMAIFSQNDKKTALDYRNYNDEKPNRNVPIILPKEIESKIFNLTKALELNTCSIDFIVNTKNEYVFLEVNPMGQLDWLSKNCNYYIEKHIAEDLMA